MSQRTPEIGPIARGIESRPPPLIVSRGLRGLVYTLPLVMMVRVLIAVLSGHAGLMSLLHLLPLLGLLGWARLMMRCPLTGIAMIIMAGVMGLLWQFSETPKAW